MPLPRLVNSAMEEVESGVEDVKGKEKVSRVVFFFQDGAFVAVLFVVGGILC